MEQCPAKSTLWYFQDKEKKSNACVELIDHYKFIAL